jgi:anaerobic magnesium-protoporphyrin IX monomethyl ester cyclase
LIRRILFATAADPYSEVENRYRPLWAASLAASAEEHLGSDIFEFRVAGGKFQDAVTSFKPDLVAISSVSQNFGIAKEYARIAKIYRIPVIVGGMHISFMPRCLTKEMDVGCIGEGEETFVELLRHFLAERGIQPTGLAGIKGIIYRVGNELVKTPKRSPVSWLDHLPHPKRSIIGYHHREYLYTARGCPHRCSFCACSRFWGGGYRCASADYVLEEIQELAENGVKVIRFNDENFVENKERLGQIADMIIARGFHKRVKFSCWCRANTVTPEAVSTLKSMNVVSVLMGLESGSERMLKYFKGNVTVEDNLRAVNLLKDEGIQTNGDFIIGAPDETLEEMMQTYEFIKTSRVDVPEINVLVPLPGSPLWDYAARRNMVSDDMDWSRLCYKLNGDAASYILLSRNLNRQEFHKVYKKFDRLRLKRALKAWLRSPWLDELPLVAWKKMFGSVARALEAQSE